MKSQICQVAIIENHPLVREALYKAINSMAGFQTAGVSSDEDDYFAMEISLRHDVLILSDIPDIILFDLENVIANDLQALKTVREKLPAVPILALTDSRSTDQEKQILEYGANVVLAKDFTNDVLFEALFRLRQRASGESFFASKVEQAIY